MSNQKQCAVEVNNNFHMKLFKELFQQEQDSFVFSPYSINFIMMMVYQGMDGQTKKEFEAVYGLPENNEMMIKGFLEFDNEIQHEQLRTANAQFIESSYEHSLKKEFTTVLKDAKFALNLCNFITDANVERTKINSWVSDKTNNLIPEILSEGSLSSDTRMVLVNTLYLKMEWIYSFSNSHNSDFVRMDNSTKKVELMKMNAPHNFPYYEDECHQIVLLPYESKSFVAGDFSMGIILQKNKGKIDPVFDFDSIIRNTQPELVDVRIPKFTTEFDIELSKMYKKFGLISAFDETNANFGKMTKTNDLYIDKICHKAKIIVDEQGTEAAAATAVMTLFGCSLPKKSKYFTADHAFQYFIMQNQSKTILFSGVFN
jgi:serpin B